MQQNISWILVILESPLTMIKAKLSHSRLVMIEAVDMRVFFALSWLGTFERHWKFLSVTAFKEMGKED